DPYPPGSAPAPGGPHPGGSATLPVWRGWRPGPWGRPPSPLRCPVGPRAAPASPPNPPRITLKNERFIALHMMYERIAPDEPTSDPAMISIELLSEKPMPAAAQPE